MCTLQLCCAVHVSTGMDLSRHPPRGNCTTASRTAGAAVEEHPQPTVACAAAAQHIPDPRPSGCVCLQVPSENMDHLPEPAIELWQKVVPLGMIFFCASFNLTILQVGCAVAGSGGLAQSVRWRDERCGVCGRGLLRRRAWSSSVHSKQQEPACRCDGSNRLHKTSSCQGFVHRCRVLSVSLCMCRA